MRWKDGEVGMSDREKVTEWLEFDYLPRVGAYRKDCKIGCDACMPKHNGDNYCDIDMLGKILALLKEQEAVEPQLAINGLWYECPVCHRRLTKDRNNYCARCGRLVKWE